MDRLLAIKILKDIQMKIPELTPQEVSLLEADESFSLHFKGLCDDCKRQVIEVANQKGLFVSEEKNELTIFSKQIEA